MFILLTGGLIASCDKEVISGDPDARLVFSSDTLLFDTIFTGIGSATRQFKVYNRHDQSLEISSVTLRGGESSPFRINADGIPGRVFENIVLRAGDSIYLFVEVTIDPLGEDSPMVIEDSVVFVTNGNVQDVKLVAWGQDVNVINGKIFETSRLTAEKPYLVYNSMLVDTGHVLSLDPGVRIHFHRKSRLYVAGSIVAEGDLDDPVVFEGARTETAYRNIPGQWEGIWLMPGSHGSRFINSRIRNAVNGIIADTLASTESPTLYLVNSSIENMTYAGILARGSTIYSVNSVVSNCGHYAVALIIGGDYEFYHCTFANYWNFSSRKTPSVIIENYYTDISGNIQLRPVNAIFANSIIHGSRDNEIDFSYNSGAGFNVEFDHCLIRQENRGDSPIEYINCLFPVSPGFAAAGEFNYRLAEGSAAIDAGDPGTGSMHPYDYDGKSRPYGDGPDIGAFERHEED